MGKVKPSSSTSRIWKYVDIKIVGSYACSSRFKCYLQLLIQWSIYSSYMLNLYPQWSSICLPWFLHGLGYCSKVWIPQLVPMVETNHQSSWGPLVFPWLGKCPNGTSQKNIGDIISKQLLAQMINSKTPKSWDVSNH